MNMIDFSNQLSPDQLMNIFKNFFEQHIAAYNIMKDMKFVDINVTTDSSSILYSVKLLDKDDKVRLQKNISNMTLNIYGKVYNPEIYINGDLLCVTIKK